MIEIMIEKTLEISLRSVEEQSQWLTDTSMNNTSPPTDLRGLFMDSWRFTHWASLLFLGLALSFFFFRNPPRPPQNTADETPKSIYDFTVKDIRGNNVPLRDYKGKVVLVVNVASKCGLTQSNYKELNLLYEKYRDQGFEILAFPCNQFGWQEPGTNEEILENACSTFKAEFPIFEKIMVNGKNAAPLFKFLKSEKGDLLGDGIKWNFTKFLVNKDGKVVKRYSPNTSPLQIEKEIENLLRSF